MKRFFSALFKSQSFICWVEYTTKTSRRGIMNYQKPISWGTWTLTAVLFKPLLSDENY